MVSFNSHQDISSLLSNALQQKNLESIDKLGLDLRDIQCSEGISKEAQIKRIAVQFEEMLISSLLKDAFPEEDKENNDSDEGPILHFGPVRDFRIMLLSQHISENGGLGYQELIEQQIKEAYANTDTDISKIDNPITKTLQSLKIIPSKGNSDSQVPEEEKLLNKSNNRPRMVQPVENGEVSSDFGWRLDPIDGKNRFHNGIDYDVPPNTRVKSYMAGKVVFSGWKKGYGYLVEVQHPNGNTSIYGHNSKLLVKEGEKVEAGTTIALSGSTGRSTGPHLHFEIRKGKVALDPARILNSAGKEVLAKAM